MGRWARSWLRKTGFLLDVGHADGTGGWVGTGDFSLGSEESELVFAFVG